MSVVVKGTFVNDVLEYIAHNDGCGICDAANNADGRKVPSRTAQYRRGRIRDLIAAGKVADVRERGPAYVLRLTASGREAAPIWSVESQETGSTIVSRKSYRDAYAIAKEVAVDNGEVMRVVPSDDETDARRVAPQAVATARRIGMMQ